MVDLIDPLVSVVIPTRNRPHLLPRAIASMLAQDYTRLEVIIVDDGSGPSTAAAIQKAAAADSRVRGLRHKASRGVAAARNAGAAAARGEYLLFDDDDCRGEPDRVRKLVEALAANPHAGYTYGLARHIETTGATTIQGTQGPWAIGTPAALIRSEVFRAAGGFDPALPRLEDFDLWTRILNRHAAVMVPEVLFESVRDDAGLSASTQLLVEAARHINEKYARSDLPSGHLAAMHRFLGGSLLVNGRRREGLRHFWGAVRFQPRNLRGWIGLAAAMAGSPAYRAAVRLQSVLGAHGYPRVGGIGR